MKYVNVCFFYKKKTQKKNNIINIECERVFLLSLFYHSFLLNKPPQGKPWSLWSWGFPCERGTWA